MTTTDDYGHIRGDDQPHPLAVAQWGPRGERLPHWAHHPHRTRAEVITRAAAELVDTSPTITSDALTVPLGLHRPFLDSAHLAYATIRAEHTAGHTFPVITIATSERAPGDSPDIDATTHVLTLLPWEAAELADALAYLHPVITNPEGTYP